MLRRWPALPGAALRAEGGRGQILKDLGCRPKGLRRDRHGELMKGLCFSLAWAGKSLPFIKISGLKILLSKQIAFCKSNTKRNIDLKTRSRCSCGPALSRRKRRGTQGKAARPPQNGGCASETGGSPLVPKET